MRNNLLYTIANKSPLLLQLPHNITNARSARVEVISQLERLQMQAARVVSKKY